MVAAPCRPTGSSGSTSAGRRSSPARSRATARSDARSRSRRRRRRRSRSSRELDSTVEQLLADGVGRDRRRRPDEPRPRRPGSASAPSTCRSSRSTSPGTLRERFGVPVGIENDGNAIALAEWRLGAGRGADDLIVLRLGTGVGGGLVLDGRLYRGWAELGHVVVDADGPPCQGNCHGRGHLEAVASGEAAERAAQSSSGARGRRAPPRRGCARGRRRGARAATDRIGHYLGIAIGSLDEHLRSGGRRRRRRIRDRGMGAPSRAGAARPRGARRSQPADETLRIVPAELGDDAGLVGAGLVAFEALDGDR